VTQHAAETYREVAESAGRWVLDQVRDDELGPWIPESVTAGDQPAPPTEFREGMHSGIGGLAHLLAEVELTRSLTDQERGLGEAVAARTRTVLGTETDVSYFDGLASHLGVLTALGEEGGADVVARMAALLTADGWPQSVLSTDRFAPEARINDATLGTAGGLLAALWASRQGIAGADRLAEQAVEVLLAEAQETPSGTDWPFVPVRFRLTPRADMPNWSHGLAGIAGALAAAGLVLERADLVQVARSGAEHLVSIADTSDDGFTVEHVVPCPEGWDEDPVTWGWCHGPAGTSLLFAALERAGVGEVRGRSPREWHRACLHSLRTSGIPERKHPGFWDNDGRCCGTAGVGDTLLDAWQRYGDEDHLAFAVELADTLAERAFRDGEHAWWRFVEHRNADPLLPPGVGWMQGAAGIAAYLFRVARVVDRGREAPAVARMDTWWALP
jgi:hypothetical protein